MQEILANFIATVDKPYDRLREWRETRSRRMVGCCPMHFPEEIVHATGLLSPVVLQQSDEPVTLGYGHIYPWFCRFVRGLIDLFVKGELGFLDGFIFPDTCLQVRGACSILRGKPPIRFFEFVRLPAVLRRPTALGATVLEELAEELGRVRASLQEFIGQEITDEAIRGSILLYNRNRALLRRLYDLRRQNPGVLPAKEILAIVQSSMLMPKEEHTELLERLLPQLEERKPSPNGKVRLFLSGHLCQAPKADILDLIEEVGGVVVDDDLYTGYRYFATDTELDGDPLKALAKRYLQNTPPCPTRHDPGNDWGEYLAKVARQRQAQGVIVMLVKSCEPHIFYYPHIKQTLSAAGINHLLLETEPEVVSLAAVRTRLQAFVEMTKQGGQ